MLHGDIRINGRAIGSWTAQCLSETPFDERKERPDAEADYEYSVKLNRQRFSGRVSHRYGDGAGVLLGKVVAAAFDLPNAR